jgi:uncharacterized protein YegL
VSVDTFTWSNLVANGATNIGSAFYELNTRLSRNSFLQAPSASVAPVIMLMSDGWPSDDWETGLAALKNNNWFKSAVKVALAIGNDADTDILAQFTGDTNSVLSVYTPETLRAMIKKVSVTSSQIGSRSQPLQNGQVVSKQEAFSQEIQSIVQTDPDFNSADTADGW